MHGATIKMERNTFKVLKCGAQRKMEYFTSTARLISKYVLISDRVKVERNSLHTVQRRKADWIGYSLRRNCPLKRLIEGKIQR
jgi:hypothetical protein